MRELAILTFQSLDGVMQGPTSPEEDPSEGFTGGGWGMPYWAEVMHQVGQEAMAEPYDILLGRTTYDMFAATWQKKSDDNATAEMMNNARKFVVATSATNDTGWKNTSRITGDVVGEISKLKAQNGRLLQVHGSCGLIQTLLEHDLIDEFRLWTFPIVLGQGKRLFGQGTAAREMQLVKSRSTAQGVVMGIYRRRGG